MWDFLSRVLESGGTTALLFVAAIGAFAYGAVELWKDNRSLRAQLKTQADDFRAATEKLVTEHRKESVEREREHAHVTSALTQRIDSLQEKRVAETRDVTEKVVKHIGNIDVAIGKFGAAVDTLVEISRR